MEGFEHLVWALGHSLWQGAVVGAGLWAMLRVVPTEKARVRYVLAVGAMVLVVFGVWVTWRVMERPEMWGARAETNVMVGEGNPKSQISNFKSQNSNLKTEGDVGVSGAVAGVEAAGRRVDWTRVLGSSLPTNWGEVG